MNSRANLGLLLRLNKQKGFFHTKGLSRRFWKLNMMENVPLRFYSKFWSCFGGNISPAGADERMAKAGRAKKVRPAGEKVVLQCGFC